MVAGHSERRRQDLLQIIGDRHDLPEQQHDRRCRQAPRMRRRRRSRRAPRAAVGRQLLATLQPARRRVAAVSGVRRARKSHASLQSGCRLRSKTSGNGLSLGLSSPRSTMAAPMKSHHFCAWAWVRLRGRVHALLGRRRRSSCPGRSTRRSRSHVVGRFGVGGIGVEDRAHEALGDVSFLSLM